MGAESRLRRWVKGLSEAEFRRRFGTEEACRAALFELRWGRGWVCPACGHGRCAQLRSRAVYQCNRCKHQVGLTAGTVFHWTKLPLTAWFLAIYHLTQSKGGMSSIELARRLGTRQPVKAGSTAYRRGGARVYQSADMRVPPGARAPGR
jgi:DNA-directed RNA polymerase subunit RPC12/RpoP